MRKQTEEHSHEYKLKKTSWEINVTKSLFHTEALILGMKYVQKEFTQARNSHDFKSKLVK